MKSVLAGQLKLLGVTVATGAALLLAVLTFQGWMRHGTDIFLSAVQSGIAWCL